MSARADWTTPADARAEVQRLWDRGRILAAELTGETLFPYQLRFRRPDGRALVERFDEVRRWIRALEAGSRAVAGAGYEIEWTEVEHRQLGRNRVPLRLVVPSREEALRWIGKLRAAERFAELTQATLGRFPVLREWLQRRPLVLLENADDWPRVLEVLAWFRDHPRSGVYVRQIDVPDVDTKFVEARRGLLMELLDLVLPAGSIDAASGRIFEARYGLLQKPALLRFRILDPRRRIAGLSDVTTPVAELAQLRLGVRRVFVTENELNGLVFPESPDAIVIFGLGYGVELLRSVTWLDDVELHYWGDLDTHGFAMLDRFRARFPHVRSFLMDRATLLAHRAQWVGEAAPHLGTLERLSVEEQALYEDLAANRLGPRVRLEQERIGFGWVERALREAVGG